MFGKAAKIFIKGQALNRLKLPLAASELQTVIIEHLVS
ncbi:hypothetical protein ACVINW_003675 [Bradyrhizobium sp. USDA 4461]